MILLKIEAKDEQAIEHIAEILLTEKLAIDITIKKNAERIELIKNQLTPSRIYAITAKTKSLLFPIIERRIREKYAEAMPELYSLPIIHMDWTQTEKITENTIKV